MMWTEMITEDQLIGRGYKKFSHTLQRWPYADYFYQKRVIDNLGTRHFVEFVHYPAASCTPVAWMCEVTNNDPHTTFQQHRVEDLDLAELRCEQFWEMLGKPYYEKD